MRYAPIPNLTGAPAVTFPIGYDSLNLPISAQALAPHWHEHVVLRLAAAAETLLPRRNKPQVFFDLLPR